MRAVRLPQSALEAVAQLLETRLQRLEETRLIPIETELARQYLAIGVLRIADTVDDPNVRMLAYLAAAFGIFAAVGISILAPFFLLHCARVLRDTTAGP